MNFPYGYLDKVVIQVPLGLKHESETLVVDLCGRQICFPVVYGDKDGEPIFHSLNVDWERVILGVYLPFYDEVEKILEGME